MTIPFKENADPVERAYYYLSKRIMALKTLEAELKPELGEDFRLDIIDERAHSAQRQEWFPIIDASPRLRSMYYGTYAHDWVATRMPIPERPDPDYLLEYVKKYHVEHPDYFDVAIWKSGILCGLGAGGYKGERERGFVSVYMIEGHPDPAHPLKRKIFNIVHKAACSYAREMGVDKVCHLGPFSKGAQKQLSRLGLRHAPVEIRQTMREGAFIEDLTPSAPGPAPRLPGGQ